jgi:hypothetical protein
MDFVFWLRRCKVTKLKTNISEENVEKVVQKIKEYIQSNSYKLPNLVNLFYDMSFLNKNTNEIGNQILKELRSNIKQLTPLVAIQILQACALRERPLTVRSYTLADFVQRNLFHLRKVMSVDEKSALFKYIAALELNLNPPRYDIPHVLYQLRNDLNDSFDRMNESSVLNILDAYRDLPIEFPSDLLNNLKEVVITTIQSNSENIKSYFLILFLEKFNNLRKSKRLNEQETEIVYEEIARRIMTDEYFGKIKNLEKVIEIYEDTEIPYQTLVEKVHAKVTSLGLNFFSLPMYQAFIKAGIDVAPLLESFLNSDFAKDLGIVYLCRLYTIITIIPGDKFKARLEPLRAKLLSSNENIIKTIQTLGAKGGINPQIEDLLLDVSHYPLCTKSLGMQDPG